MASLIKRRVRPLAASIGSTFVEGCDVRDDDEIKKVFEKWHAREGDLDILVHAVAYAEKEDLAGNFSRPAATASTPPSTSASTR
jgi:enoyl-[acyl-carrier protein] reductase I